MSSNTKICCICGASYEYCPRCRQFANQPRWRMRWDTEQCKDIDNTVSGFSMGLRTEEDVKSLIKQYKIKDISMYTPRIQEVLSKFITKKRKKKVDIDLEQETDTQLN